MADFTSLRRQVRTRANRARVIAAADMKTRYRTVSPYKSGDTQESVDVINFVDSPTQLTCTAVATTPQSKWTDQGTRPHVIRPRRAKALRFRVGGRIVYATKVQHPGNKGTGWFSKLGEREWGNALQRAYQRLG